MLAKTKRRRVSRSRALTHAARSTWFPCAAYACCTSGSTSCAPTCQDAFACSLWWCSFCPCKPYKPELPTLSSLPGPLGCYHYSSISVTTPEATVRPPSRIAYRSSFSIAIGVISSINKSTSSPGITISRPSGSVATPVTSVVRK